MSQESELILPLEPILALHKSPANLVIFSKYKVGKTTLLSKLDKGLILDLENGSDFVDAVKLKANSIEDIKKIGAAIEKANYPYNYIAVDTVTALEEMCVSLAEKLYAGTPMGSAWETKGKKTYGSILNLPNGSGYQFLRLAFFKVVDYIKTLAPRVIFLGHLKDTLLEKNGAEFNSLELDLTGKIKRILMAKADAIGYLYRKGNQNILSFKTSDEISCGARPDYLRNEEIVVSEVIEGVVHTYWDKVFID